MCIRDRFHLNALHTCYKLVFITENFNRVVKELKDNACLLYTSRLLTLHLTSILSKKVLTLTACQAITGSIFFLNILVKCSVKSLLTCGFINYTALTRIVVDVYKRQIYLCRCQKTKMKPIQIKNCL